MYNQYIVRCKKSSAEVELSALSPRAEETLTLHSANPGIFCVEGRQLTAKSGGTAALTVTWSSCGVTLCAASVQCFLCH